MRLLTGNIRSRRLLVALGLWAATGVALAVDPLRCGDQVVERGQRPYEVVERCGTPGYEFRRIEWRYPGILVQVDEWVYDLGRNRFRRELLFENGRLIDINLRGRPIR
ncbi:MAG: DUF2845 domain-containing protein [Pseudomonadota bacterium]